MPDAPTLRTAVDASAEVADGPERPDLRLPDGPPSVAALGGSHPADARDLRQARREAALRAWL